MARAASCSPHPVCRNPADRRPGSRDLVLDARKPPRLVRGFARRRPVRRQRRAGDWKHCCAAPRYGTFRRKRRKSRGVRSEPTQRPLGGPRTSANPRRLGARAARSPSPFDLVFATSLAVRNTCIGHGGRPGGRRGRTGWHPTAGWRSKPREPTPSSGSLDARRDPQCRPREAYAFALGLAFFDAFLISSNSLESRRPMAAAAAFPAALTVLPDLPSAPVFRL